MYYCIVVYVCSDYKVARADGLVNDTVSLTAQLQDGRNDSDSVKLLVVGTCATCILLNTHSNVFDVSLV